MKMYKGQRPADDESCPERSRRIGGCRVYVIEGDKARPLYHVKYHSDAFEWGYGGSGPADTSLSILADYFGEKRLNRKQIERGESRAWQWHQPFKWARFAVAPADHTGFTITEEQITEWLTKQEGEHKDDVEDAIREGDEGSGQCPQCGGFLFGGECEDCGWIEEGETKT